MGGWDNDKSGDYVPKPPPAWFWVIVGLGFFAIFVLPMLGR